MKLAPLLSLVFCDARFGEGCGYVIHTTVIPTAHVNVTDDITLI
jgi:hypothetical protein